MGAQSGDTFTTEWNACLPMLKSMVGRSRDSEDVLQSIALRMWEEGAALSGPAFASRVAEVATKVIEQARWSARRIARHELQTDGAL